MNKIFKVVWNKTTNSAVVTSELATGKVKANSPSTSREIKTSLLPSKPEFVLSSIAMAAMMLTSVNSYAAVQIDSTGRNSVSTTGATAGTDAVAIGKNANAVQESIAIGLSANAQGENNDGRSIAIGSNATAHKT